MGTANEDIADALVDHRLALLRFEAGAVRSVTAAWLDYTDALIQEAKRIKRRAKNAKRALLRSEVERLRSISDALAIGLRTVQGDMTERARAAMEEAAAVEAQVVAESIEAALPPSDPADGLRVAVVPPSDLARSITDPIGGRVWTARLASDLVDAHDELQAVIANAISNGESMPNAAKALEAATGIREKYRNRYVAIVRTEIQRVANTAAADTYAQNAGIVKAVQYLATLDSRTCPVCAPLHNQVFPLGDDGRVPVLIPGTDYRRPPIHPRCRCFLSPVTRSWRELGLDLDDPLERDRLDGRKAINMDFEAWLKRQPESTQADILGAKRADLWRRGRLKLERFSDRGRVLSLGELRARYPSRVPAEA